MKLLIASVLILISFPLGHCPAQTSLINDGLQLIASVPLPGVSGRIDHMSYNGRNYTLFIAALGNNTVEVVDLKNKRTVHTIKGLHEPQGIKYIAETNVVVVANGETGECDIFDADTFQPIANIKMPGGDADNVRYDPAAGKIYVGYGDGGIAVIDRSNYKQIADIKLPGHPESFQLSGDSKRLFVNIPDAGMIAALDLQKNSISDRWKIDVARENFPMALDAGNNLLLIGCRNPAKLLAVNAETGKIGAQIDIDSDTDDISYDAVSHLIYVSCGGGYIDIIKQNGPDSYASVSRLRSRPGARTSFFIPERNQLVVAAPARSGSEAQLLIYAVPR